MQSRDHASAYSSCFTASLKFQVHSLIILPFNDYYYFRSCRLALFHIDLRCKGYVERVGALHSPSSCLTEAKERSPMDVGEDDYGGFPFALNCAPLRAFLALSSQSKTIVASIVITTKAPVHTLAR